MQADFGLYPRVRRVTWSHTHTKQVQILLWSACVLPLAVGVRVSCQAHPNLKRATARTHQPPQRKPHPSIPYECPRIFVATHSSPSTGSHYLVKRGKCN